MIGATQWTAWPRSKLSHAAGCDNRALGTRWSAIHRVSMSSHQVCTALVIAGLGGAGCIVDSGPDLRITTLEVTGEVDFGLLDVEVHLFDASTHEHLGCSGEYEGLEGVDLDDVTYRLDAWVREPYADVAVAPRDLTGRMIELQVIEDDLGQCPDPPGLQDDVIGISPPLDRSTFDSGLMLSFDRVSTIQLVIN